MTASIPSSTSQLPLSPSSLTVFSWSLGFLLALAALNGADLPAQLEGYLIVFVAAFIGLGAVLRTVAARGRWALAGFLVISLVAATLGLERSFGESPKPASRIAQIKCGCASPGTYLFWCAIVMLAFVVFEKRQTTFEDGAPSWRAWLPMRVLGLLLLISAIEVTRLGLHHFRGLAQDLDYCQKTACGFTLLAEGAVSLALAGMWYFCPRSPRSVRKLSATSA